VGAGCERKGGHEGKGVDFHVYLLHEIFSR
jgi:hypothetical protein